MLKNSYHSQQLRRSARDPRPIGADGHQARPKTAPHKVGWEHPLRLSLEGESTNKEAAPLGAAFLIPRLSISLSVCPCGRLPQNARLDEHRSAYAPPYPLVARCLQDRYWAAGPAKMVTSACRPGHRQPVPLAAWIRTQPCTAGCDCIDTNIFPHCRSLRPVHPCSS